MSQGLLNSAWKRFIHSSAGTIMEQFEVIFTIDHMLRLDAFKQSKFIVVGLILAGGGRSDRQPFALFGERRQAGRA
jgi:hypothetical protein